MKVISVNEMRRLEAEAINNGIPAERLMLAAGTNATDELLLFADLHYAPRHRRAYTVVAGKGNNGGDALVVAKLLAESGHAVAVYSTCPLADYTGAAGKHAAMFPPTIPFSVLTERLPDCALTPGHILIDGILGTGLTGDARGLCANLIRQINASQLPVISLDIPSGLNGDSGMGGDIIRADLTITMAFPKTGLLQGHGPENCGEIRIADIDLPADIAQTAHGDYQAFTAIDARSMLKRRPAGSHKNTFGHLLCIAGSKTYPGAPFLAAEAALRSGSGLVTLAIPAGTNIRQGSAALIVAAIGDKSSTHFTAQHWSQIEQLSLRATAVLFGPGVTTDVDTDFTKAVFTMAQPLLIDADGLRILAANQSLANIMKNRRIPALLTPHPGEMRALLTGLGLRHYINAPAKEQAAALAHHCNAVVLLKGQHSIVANCNGETSINLSGSPALATAGTGDVLSGIAAALLAQNLQPYNALRLAAFIHGHAGDLSKTPQASLIADDLHDLIPKAIADISPLA